MTDPRAALATVLLAACAAPTGGQVAKEARMTAEPTTPEAVEALRAHAGSRLELRDVPAESLGWQEVPADARLQALVEGERVVAYVHARRGRWRSRRTPDLAPGPVPLAGVIADALVWTRDADTLRSLLHPTSVKSPDPIDTPWSDPFPGRPLRFAGGVVEWGPFSDAVPEGAIRAALAIAGARTVILTSLTAEAHGPRETVVAHAEDHRQALLAIARDIEGLRDRYPQLAGFSATASCDPERLVITYQHRVGPPGGRGGWVAGLPQPEPDGIWLYLDFHDRGSTAQIHTQPVVPERRRGDKRVMVLLVEGARARSLAPALEDILRRHGVTTLR